ncbi:MAG: 4Fe-4S binding protein [Gudongella sp.]|nr:4Fe-4S binding protein [Gudongella sp.]
MKLKKRSLIQIISVLVVSINLILYYLYLKDRLDFRTFSVADLNPYAGWSHLKAYFTDVSYRFRGITIGIALSLALVLNALIFGRLFCGYICPIGSSQDFSNHLGRKLGFKEIKISETKSFKFEYIKYIVLIVALVLSILGAGSILAKLSPWIGFLNIFMGLTLSYGLIVFCVILIISLFIRRPFCRGFCPLGAFFSLISALGFTKIKNDKDCKGCSVCLAECPVEITKAVEGQIPPECVNCLECVENNCIKNDSGFQLSLFNKKINTKLYIAVGLISFLVIFSMVPYFNFAKTTNTSMIASDLNDGNYIGTGVGFGGTMYIDLSIENEKIKSIEVKSHRETSGYYEEVFKNLSRDIIRTQDLNLDVISGATASTRGFTSAVKNAVGQSMAVD